ncbi:hypothetical protein ACNKHV_04585 [Shigella flexneri]
MAKERATRAQEESLRRRGETEGEGERRRRRRGAAAAVHGCFTRHQADEQTQYRRCATLIRPT